MAPERKFTALFRNTLKVVDSQYVVFGVLDGKPDGLIEIAVV